MGETIYFNNSIKKRSTLEMYRYTKYIYTLLFFSSISHAVWGLFSVYPQLVKIFSSGCLWTALILIIKTTLLYKNKKRRIIDWLVISLLSITFLQFLRFFILENGENLITTITNPYYGLCLCIPILYYTTDSFLSLKFIYKYGMILAFISSVICLRSNYYVMYLLPIIIYYGIYLKTKSKIFIYLLLLFSLIFILKDAFIPDNLTGDTQRALLIPLSYSFAIIIAKKIKKFYRLIAVYIAIISITLPISLFCYSVATNESIFQQMNNLENEKLNTDTRTFLYVELLTDLKKNDAFLQGLGIAKGYYSPFFSHRNSDLRDINEVHFLHYLMRGGGIWLILYMMVIIYSIFYAIKKSNNYLCLGGSIILSGYFFAGFICDINSFNFIHVILWFFISVCSSPKWNQLSNLEILKLIK